MFSVTGRGKRTLWERAQPLLYCWNMTYAVMSHRIRHLPEIQYDTFDIMSQATSVGGKLPTDVFQPITAKNGDR